METISCSLLEGSSHSLWLLSGILSQLKHAGFNPPDPALFSGFSRVETEGELRR